MIDWTYGILESFAESEKEKIVWQTNPIFLDNIVIFKKKAAKFTIKGPGKIIQISFTSDSRDALIAFEIDETPSTKVNNGYCLSNLCDTRGIGCFQIQKKGKKEGKIIWRYTCLLPVIFDEKVNVFIVNEAHESENINVSNVHIYYLIPKEVKIK